MLMMGFSIQCINMWRTTTLYDSFFGPLSFAKWLFFLFILGPAEYIFLQKCILSENNLHSKYTLASILLENNLNSKIIIISSKLLRLELNFAPLLLHTTMPWWHKCRTNGKCLLNAHNRKLVWGSTVKSSTTLSGSKLFSDIYTKSHRIFGRVVWTYYTVFLFGWPTILSCATILRQQQQQD